MRTPMRDVLTGDPIRSDSLLYVVRTPLRAAPARYREEVDYIAPPIRLHRGETEGVGLSYSSMMARYLQAVISGMMTEERIAAECWWNNDYGVRRVRSGLERLYPARAARHILDVILTMHRDELDPAEVAERYDHSAWWVVQRFQTCMRLAHAHSQMCGCEACEARRARRAKPAAA